MIQLENVTVDFDVGGSRPPLFEDLTAVIPTNRRFALLGGRGAGKSTLINLIAGRRVPTAGEIVRHANVSYPVGLSGGFERTVTVRQNIAFVARLYEADPSEILEFVLRATELKGIGNTILGELKMHDRQRIGYALSYALPFDTYLVDGLVGAGDEAFQKKCADMLEARAQHAGVIFASRISGSVKRFCDCGALIHNGALEFYDDVILLIERFEELFPRASPRRPRVLRDSD